MRRKPRGGLCHLRYWRSCLRPPGPLLCPDARLSSLRGLYFGGGSGPNMSRSGDLRLMRDRSSSTSTTLASLATHSHEGLSLASPLQYLSAICASESLGERFFRSFSFL